MTATTNFKNLRGSAAGFTLIEMLVVATVLVVLMGVVFSYVGKMQRTYKAEETKVDATEETRTFFDGLARELHQAGYPSKNMYAPGLLLATSNNDSRVAVGLVKVSASDLWFEGDIDGDGVVESIRYTLFDNAGNTISNASVCPCTLKRSQIVKANNTAPTAQATNYTSELDRVINSGGLGAGGGALTITGNTVSLAGASLSLDTLYSAYKTPQLFTAFDSSGTVVALPVDLTSNAIAVTSIRSITVNVNLLAETVDTQTNTQAALSMRQTVRIATY